MAPRPGVPPLPAHFELSAPASWGTVDLVSDLHLSAALPRTFAAFSAYLSRTTADAVFILGDLFEAWVGDDMADHGFERECVAMLALAATQRALGFMVGNRDFLAGAGLLNCATLINLPDPTLLEAWGQRVLLTHGDALCLADVPYQAFRAEVRSPAWQTAFLARPLTERLKIAADIRHASQSRRQFDGAADADVDPAEAVRWLQAAQAAEMVHGHTHRPGSNGLAPGFTRHVLSDWDLDTQQRAEVLRLTHHGFQRLSLDQV
jgi:UDP-2,3-diacylglucosamine hydrolase